MKCFGPQFVAYFCIITMRFQEDAKYFRDCAAGQLQLNQLITKDLYRLKIEIRTWREKCRFIHSLSRTALMEKMLKKKTAHLVIRWQAWIMECSLHQLHQQVLDLSLAVAQA